jgi:signal transduction histidine kinase
VFIDAVLRDETIRLSIRDNGCGGADLAGGTGLIGLKDRIEALNGRIEVHSPLEIGTTILVEIPIAPSSDETPPIRRGI